MKFFVPVTHPLFNAATRGRLYWTDNVEELGQDMLEVEFPSGVLLAAGWYPDGDPNGAFEITVTNGFRLLEKNRTRDFAEAESYVQELVWKYGFADRQQPRFSSFSTNTFHQFTVNPKSSQRCQQLNFA